MTVRYDIPGYEGEPTQIVRSIGGSGASANAVQGTAADNAAMVGNPVPVGALVETTLSTYAAGDVAALHSDGRGNLRAHTVLTGVAGSDTVANTAIGVALISSGLTGLYPAAMGHSLSGTVWVRNRVPSATARLPSSAASTNATSVTAAFTALFNVNGYNGNAAVRYLKIYNKATAPTVGTDVPAITLVLPATSAFNFNLFQHSLTTGFGYALTTGAADNDNTGVGAGDILGLNIGYSL